MENEILRIEQVSKEYDLKKHQKLKAVNNVSLTVHKGECVGIVGESGCGKSTLAKLITCVEPVSKGEIWFEGKDISNMKKAQRKEYYRRVQMIFQNPSSAFSPRMRVGTFLMEPWINFAGMSRKDAWERAIEGIKSVDLDESYMKKYPHQLSGGELQRVAIARALSQKPGLLICDEATSALDVSIQDQVLSLLEAVRKETSVTTLFISHDLAVTERISDRIVVMYLGQIVEIVKGDHLKERAKHPYTRSLLDSVFSVRDGKEKPICILPGEPPSPVNLPEGCIFCERCKYAEERCRTRQPELKIQEDGGSVACCLY